MQLANGRTQVFMFLRKVYPFLLEENILLINDRDIKKNAPGKDAFFVLFYAPLRVGMRISG